MKKIFISYRSHDSRWQARMIYDALLRVLPRERLFMDIDSIPPGADFVEILEGWVGACEIMLALIGAGQIGAADPKTGRRRLDNPHDFVRIEIREALKRGIPVVPVLLDDTSMPDADELPDDLRSLVRRQAEFVQFRTFDGCGAVDEEARGGGGVGGCHGSGSAPARRRRGTASPGTTSPRTSPRAKVSCGGPHTGAGRRPQSQSDTMAVARCRRAVPRPRRRPRIGRACRQSGFAARFWPRFVVGHVYCRGREGRKGLHQA